MRTAKNDRASVLLGTTRGSALLPSSGRLKSHSHPSTLTSIPWTTFTVRSILKQEYSASQLRTFRDISHETLLASACSALYLSVSDMAPFARSAARCFAC